MPLECQSITLWKVLDGVCGVDYTLIMSMKTLEEHNLELRRARYLSYEPASVSCPKCGASGKGVEMRFIPRETTYFNAYEYRKPLNVVCPECETREAMEAKPEPTCSTESYFLASGARVDRKTWSDGRVEEKIVWPDPVIPEPPVRRSLPVAEPKKPVRLLSDVELARSGILWSLFAFEAVYAVWKHFIEPR